MVGAGLRTNRICGNLGKKKNVIGMESIFLFLTKRKLRMDYSLYFVRFFFASAPLLVRAFAWGLEVIVLYGQFTSRTGRSFVDSVGGLCDEEKITSDLPGELGL